MKLSMKDVTVEKAESLVDQIQEVQGSGRAMREELWSPWLTDFKPLFQT